MIRISSILQLMTSKIKLLLLFILILPLCACEDTCPTIQDYISIGVGTGMGDCLLCPIFNVLIDTSKAVAVDAWRKLASDLIPVVGIVSSIYIAIYTLKMVSSFGKQTANDYMTSDKNGLLLLMFKTAIIVFLLSGGIATVLEGAISGFLGGNESNENFLIDKIIAPILKSGLEIGQTLSVRSGNGRSFDFYSSTGIKSLIDGFLGSPWAAIFEMIRQAIYGFLQVTYEPIAIGQAMICNSTFDTPLEWYYLMLLYGFILFIFGWLLTLGISFYIIDIIIDLMFAAVLLPVGIACAISPKTVGYTKRIWGLFINVFFNFVMLGIVLGISMRMVDLCLNRSVIEVPGVASAVIETGGAIANFMTNYQNHVDANEIKQLSEELWTNGNLLLTIVSLSIATMLVSGIKELANSIAGEKSLTNVGGKVSSTAGQHTLRAVERGGKEGFNRIIKPSAEHIGGKVVRATRLDKVYNKGAQWSTAARGFLTGRGSQGYRAWWRR